MPFSPTSVDLSKSLVSRDGALFSASILMITFSSDSITLRRLRSQTLWVRFRLHAPELKQAGREPLNLSVVFDRSASMNIDSKIGFVRKAGHILTDNLTPHDYVSLIAYNHEVQVLVPMHPVVNREYLHHRIDELTAAGDTNISGGFLEGCAQLEKRLREPGQHHVLLLTDGLANRGVTDVRALVSLVQRAKARGIGV